MISSHALSRLYRQAHDTMRNCDGLQPQEAFEELLKFLYLKESAGVEIALSAAQIRRQFKDQVKNGDAWLSEYWKDRDFHLSDVALDKIRQLFLEVDLKTLDLDLRSSALREFMSPDIRRGLGIYLTPDNVVRMMVDVAAPTADSRVYDPACGSGTFLIEAIRNLRGIVKKGKTIQVWGADKSPRMLTLSLLNIGGLPRIEFRHRVADALASAESSWPRDAYYDLILTNPPFGVTVDSQTTDFSRFKTCAAIRGAKKVQSEVLFIERCLQLLRPGGTLGIVLPKSVVTNGALEQARAALDTMAYVSACVVLPPETFHTAGTQTNTVVLFFRKFAAREALNEQVRIPLIEVSNVGYDSTGRHREGDQLPLVAEALKATTANHPKGPGKILLGPISKTSTLTSLGQKIIDAGSNPIISRAGSKKLGDVASLVRTGKTPGRAAYTDSGLFLVKVGNLSGHGIDWTPRDRNFVGEYSVRTTLLQRNDILLTSSAHTPHYIAKKCDIISVIPDSVGGKASFVGEVMLVRPDRKAVNPLLLLAFLRLPSTIVRIQRMVRGQTAHLGSADLMELELPAELFRDSVQTRALEENLREETALVDQLSAVIVNQRELTQALFVRKESRRANGVAGASLPVPVLSGDAV